MTHSKEDLRKLLSMAESDSGSNMTTCSVLYRNKPREYFEALKNSDESYQTMRKYIKDKSGDQKSPINLCISGLFFSASVARNNTPRSMSAFGDTRIHVPVNLIADNANLYFADFFCMQDPARHYVTLVMTKPNTVEDNFCQSRLIKLSFENNIFFKRILAYKNTYEVNSNDSLLVEIIYTEDLDINAALSSGGRIENNVPTFGKGKSSKGGLPKNTACTTCCLEPTSVPPRIYQRRNRRYTDSDSDSY